CAKSWKRTQLSSRSAGEGQPLRSTWSTVATVWTSPPGAAEGPGRHAHASSAPPRGSPGARKTPTNQEDEHNQRERPYKEVRNEEREVESFDLG
ncbi:Hypothetical predicted protein, partial [Marmota monax]